jgi:transposase-like protein
MARWQDRQRERYWRKVIRDQAASGLSISAFCREHEVPAASFFAWRRKLSQRPEVSERRAAKERPSANELIEKPAAQFVSFELPSPPHSGRAGLEIVLPDGCRVLVGELCDADWLRQILAAVRERAC